MSNLIRSNTTVILSLVYFLAIQSSAWAQKPGHGRGEYFNVRDFGAKGAGGDDTEGIKAAIAAATRGCWGEKPPGSVHYASEPVVFFPSGKYKISETLQAGGTDCQVLLAAGPGIGNIQLEDEAAVVRTDAHGTVDVGDEFRVDVARPNPTSVNGHLAGIPSRGLRHRRSQTMCLLSGGCNAKRF